jgi:hypothetical protein
MTGFVTGPLVIAGPVRYNGRDPGNEATKLVNSPRQIQAVEHEGEPRKRPWNMPAEHAHDIGLILSPFPIKTLDHESP